MDNIIIYASCYGSSKKYAEKLASIVNYDCVCIDEVKDLSVYNSVILFGGVYGGIVNGLAKVVDLIVPSSELIICTVGLTDGANKTNIEKLEANIAQTLPKNKQLDIKYFHVQGAMDYNNLSIEHKALMDKVYAMLNSIPKEKLNEDHKVMLSTQGKVVDEINFNLLDPIVQYLK